MAALTQKDTRLKLQFVANTVPSIHAGLDCPPPNLNFPLTVARVSLASPKPSSPITS